MAKAPPTRVQRQRKALEFLSASELGSFLLTCMEATGYSRGTPIFEDCLNRIYIRTPAPHQFHVRLLAEAHEISRLEQMALANGGKVRPVEELTGQYVQKSLDELLRIIRLQPAPVLAAPDHVLVALWECGAEQLREVLIGLNDLDTARCEVAFVEQTGPGLPTHLIQLHGVSHGDAVLSWASSRGRLAQAYLPYQSEGGHRFFVQRGYRFPLPGLDVLSSSASELVLLKQAESGATQWLDFEPHTLNFFRKMHEILEAEVDLKPTRQVELKEGAQPGRLPLELALASDTSEAPLRLWQLDKLIDLQRQKLNELEKRRQRLAAGKTGDVYFAYKFEQRGEEHLNPLLVRFLQQRLGVLADYEYAWCQPAEDAPFHLVIAQRTQRQIGFGMQLADEIYYQPEEFRQWGVNLYLPIGQRLLPSLGSNDAVPLLQQLFEKAEGRDAQAESGDAKAVLWKDLGNARISETRIRETRALVDQFHILNSFQRGEARQIAEQTRRSLAEGLRKARENLAISCRDLENDILTYIGARAEQVEATYQDLRTQVAAAEADLAAREPQIAQAVEFVARIPNQWAEFVTAVIEINRHLMQDRTDAYEAMREEYRVGGRRLRALASCHRDLGAQIQAWQTRLVADQKAISDDLALLRAMMDQGTQVSASLFAIAVEIRQAYGKLEDRLKAIAAAQQRADRIQLAIDSVDEQEHAVKTRLKHLETVREQMREREEKLKAAVADAQAKEIDSASKAAELAQAEEEMFQRLRDASARLLELEADLQRVVADAQKTEQLFDAVQEEASMLHQRAEISGRWVGHASRWAAYLASEYATIQQKEAVSRQAVGVEKKS